MIPRLRPAVLSLLVLLAAAASPCHAQLGRTHPDQRYFAAWDEIYAGSFRRGERVMRGELRSAVKTVNSRWIDSIFYASGLGEALYQQGRLAESLAQFDNAIDVFLSQPDWMTNIQFQQQPREDNSLARRLPPWAQPANPVRFARMPRSFLIQLGQINNNAAAAQGGVIQQGQLWKLDAEELARAIAWTLYRRSQLLGSLGAYDGRTNAVATRIAGGGLGPAQHWSNGWTELWWGLASAGAGNSVQATPHLDRSLRLAGQLDHRLSGIAWLAKGRLAAGASDPAAAITAFHQAIVSATAYEDVAVLVESTRAWHELASVNPKVPPPPLAGMIGWAERQGYWQLATAARLGLIEQEILAGETGNAPRNITQAFRRADDAANGLLGREGDRLLALAAATSSTRNEAVGLAQQAIGKQATMSRRRFQVQLANSWYDTGKLASRSAQQALAGVLDDPSRNAWNTDPLDALAWIAAPETGAFERWFAAAEERREALLAIRVVDRQRRREFFASQPMAGRHVAIRWLLEAPDEALPASAIESRAQLDTPAYRNLRQAGLRASDALRTAIAEAEENSNSPLIDRSADELIDSINGRERLALQAAFRRTSTPLVFPPPIDPVAAKQQMAAGEALLVFHEARGDVYGLVLTAGGEHLWRIGPAEQVRVQVERLLREVAGLSPDQSWSAAELTEATWQAPADELGTLLLGGSRLDASTLERLWIVPVGSLWRAPLALLPIPSTQAAEDDEPVRLGDLTMTLAPTPGWAMRSRPPRDETPTDRPTWALAAESAKNASYEGIDPAISIASLQTPPKGLDATVQVTKAVASSVLVDLGGQPIASDPLGLRTTRTNAGTREIFAWSRLPYGGSDAVALIHHAGGEAGGGKLRRSKNAPSVGAAELHTVCALLAGGTESVLIDRWATRGARSREFVAEWLNGVERLGAAEAWARSLALARTRPLDPTREPRLTIEVGEKPTAEHPFWWAGYLLID